MAKPMKKKPDISKKIAKAMMAEETEESSARSIIGGAAIVPLKDIKGAMAGDPNAPVPQAEIAPRYSAPKTAISALLPSGPMRMGDEREEPMPYMTERLLSPANLPFFTRLSDDEIKAIALLTAPYTACGRRAHSAFLDNSIANLIAHRVSLKAEGRNAFERIMEALGFRREEAARNPVQALFDMKARRP